MLKIKEEVDLKELEKFGFKPKYDVDTGKLKKLEKRDSSNNEVVRISFIDNDHCHEPYLQIGWVSESDTLYDLIQAGLVEKVEG